MPIGQFFSQLRHTLRSLWKPPQSILELKGAQLRVSLDESFQSGMDLVTRTRYARGGHGDGSPSPSAVSSLLTGEALFYDNILDDWQLKRRQIQQAIDVLEKQSKQHKKSMPASHVELYLSAILDDLQKALNGHRERYVTSECETSRIFIALSQLVTTMRWKIRALLESYDASTSY